MKKILVLILSCISFTVCAQSDCDITMGVYFSGNNSEMTAQSKTYLKNVINKVITDGNGISILEDSQFGVVVSADVIDEHVVSGAPTKYVLNLSVTLSIANLQDGKLFSSFSLDLNGVGNSKVKAYNNAIKNIKIQNKSLNDFAIKAKDHIIGYYNRNYKSIISKAEAEANVRNYEEAIYNLMCIPVCCKGYDECMAKVRTIYKQYIDQKCHENIAQAQAAWMSGYTRENATVASTFLAEIYPDATCFGDAMELVAEIKNHMGEEWKFEMKRWDDLVNIEAQQLNFAREIALAYAKKNQPQPIIHF